MGRARREPDTAGDCACGGGLTMPHNWMREEEAVRHVALATRSNLLSAWSWYLDAVRAGVLQTRGRPSPLARAIWDNKEQYGPPAPDPVAIPLEDWIECYSSSCFSSGRMHYSFNFAGVQWLEREAWRPDVEVWATEIAAAWGLKPAARGTTRRGPEPTIQRRVEEEIRAALQSRKYTPTSLRGLKQESLAKTFGASRGTVIKARDKVLAALSELSEFETLTNSDTK
jgi:hypothetical protein